MFDSIVTVAVISDTHAHLDSRIADIVRECDIAVHAGDICGAEILSEMQPKTGKVYAVTGNNDPYCHVSKKSLPEVISFDVHGAQITVEHGHIHGMQQPSHEALREAHPDSKLIIYGHTHKNLIDKEEMPWIINPGAAGKTRTHGGPSCLVIKCSDLDEWEIINHKFSEEKHT